MVNSEELIGTPEYLTLQAGCRINRGRYNRVQLYFNSYKTSVAAFKYHQSLTNVSICILRVLSSLFSRQHVKHKHIKISHVILNPIKRGLNCNTVISNHDALC
jgi:hypothetical protein